MTRRRRLLIGLCVLVTVLPAAVAGFGLASAQTGGGTTCPGPTPTPTPTPTPAPTPNPTPSPVPLCKPTLTKAFAPDTVTVGDPSTLTFTVTNPNQTVALSGVSFSDDLPSGIEIVAPLGTTCGLGAVVTAPNGGSQITMSQGTVDPASNCILTVSVHATVSGEFLNTTSDISANGIGGPGDPATATLTATPAYALGALVTDTQVAGQIVSFSMRAPAQVLVRVARRNRHHKYKRVRTLQRHAKRGRNRIRLRKLRQGHYRLTIRALAHGDRGLATKRNFTVR